MSWLDRLEGVCQGVLRGRGISIACTSTKSSRIEPVPAVARVARARSHTRGSIMQDRHVRTNPSHGRSLAGTRSRRIVLIDLGRQGSFSFNGKDMQSIKILCQQLRRYSQPATRIVEKKASDEE
jgi:hypothetical protein